MYNDLFTTDNKNSKDRFVKALFSLLASKHLDDISVTLLCKEAGLSRKTFYKHFSTISDIVKLSSEELLMTYHKNRPTEWPDEIKHDIPAQYMYHFYAFYYEHLDITKILIENNLTSYMFQVTPFSLGMLTKRDWGQYLSDDMDNFHMYVEFMNAGILRTLECWYQDDFQKTPLEMAMFVSKILSGEISQSIEQDK